MPCVDGLGLRPTPYPPGPALFLGVGRRWGLTLKITRTSSLANRFDPAGRLEDGRSCLGLEQSSALAASSGWPQPLRSAPLWGSCPLHSP